MSSESPGGLNLSGGPKLLYILSLGKKPPCPHGEEPRKIPFLDLEGERESSHFEICSNPSPEEKNLTPLRERDM